MDLDLFWKLKRFIGSAYRGQQLTLEGWKGSSDSV